MKTFFCSGNEAVALGARKSGVKVVTGYPGAPITKALEYLAEGGELYTEWSVNEKVAYEVALGASINGVRSLVIMKTLGLNVAADAFTQSTGGFCHAGLVLIVADDNGREIGDDYQDSRYYGQIGEIPVLEPGTCQEIYEYMQWAFILSEQFGVPVMVRMNSITTRIKERVVDTTVVSSSLFLGEEQKRSKAFFGQKTILNIVNHGFSAQALKKLSEYTLDFHDRYQKIKRIADSLPINQIIPGNSRMGIITSGVLFQYCREVYPEANYLKLGLIHPLPIDLIRKFSAGLEEIFVVEEIHPLLETAIKAEGFEVLGHEVLKRPPVPLHLTPEIIKARVDGFLESQTKTHPVSSAENNTKPAPVPVRLPQNCAGCPHLTTFFLLKKLKVKVVSGIGCCGLSSLPILKASCIVQSMGSPPGILHGMYISSDDGERTKSAAVFGDGEFWHSGLMGIINAVFHRSKIKVIILDNNVIAMTGGQAHPSTVHSRKEKKRLDIKKLCRVLGIKAVYEINPDNYKKYLRLLKREFRKERLSVFIVKKKCSRVYRPKQSGICVITDQCKQCGECLETGCAGLEKNEKKMVINPQLCTGCRLCQYVCPVGAIIYKKQELKWIKK